MRVGLIVSGSLNWRLLYLLDTLESLNLYTFDIIFAGLTYLVRAISGTKTVDNVAVSGKFQNEEESPENWKIKMLYDGDCPLCMREVWFGIQR